MRAIPEIVALTKGIIFAMRSVITVILFVVAVLYVVALVFKESVGHMNEFSHVLVGMETLFLTGVLGDRSPHELAKAIYQESIYMYVLFIIFMLFTTFTLMNMLICMICEVVTNLSESQNAQVDAKTLIDLLQF